MAYEPDVDVGNDASQMAHKPSAQDGTVIQEIGDGDLNAVVELQGPIAQKNPFQEVNLFVAEMARIYQIEPRAAMVRIQDILQAMLVQVYA